MAHLYTNGASHGMKQAPNARAGPLSTAMAADLHVEGPPAEVVSEQ